VPLKSLPDGVAANVLPAACGVPVGCAVTKPPATPGLSNSMKSLKNAVFE